MGDSWRNILERAGNDLTVDVDAAAPQRRPEARLSSLSRPAVQSYRSFEESRALLERELAALSSSIPTAYVEPPQTPRQEASTPAGALVRTAPISRPIAVKPPQKESRRAKRSRAWRNVAAVSISGAVVVASGYLLVGYLKSGSIKMPYVPQIEKAFVIGPRPAMAEARPAPVQASVSVPEVAATPEVHRGTEDELMERGLSQLSQGDGAGARAVLEVLAHYGSVRGAFALAETYDPVTVARRPDWGLAADVERAREWYRKAADLGSFTAYQRLKEFDTVSQSSLTRRPNAA